MANAARRLHQGLLKSGVQSSLYMASVPASTQAAEQIFPFPKPNRLLYYVDSASKLVSAKFGLIGLTHVSSHFWSFPDADVIHLHGAAARWFNLNALKGLGRERPIVWTMHDQLLGTGGCGYPQEWDQCEGWRRGCGNCPLSEHEGWWLDLTRQTFSRKKTILESLPAMAVVAPNHWMLDFISTSAITRNQILRRIPYGVDTEVFSPYPMAEARRELGLPVEASLLLCVASEFKRPRKGMHYIAPLLKNLRELAPDQNWGLILAGEQPDDDFLAEVNTVMPIYVLGHIDTPTHLAKVYSAADCFVITARLDNFPNVVLESMACGTPSAGFRVGGIPDMIVPERTGILVELGDTTTMASQIHALLKQPKQLADMRLTSREQAVTCFSLEIQTKQYLTLYQELQAKLNPDKRPS